MPKRLAQDIDQQVLTHVGNSPDGLTLDELLRLLKGESVADHFKDAYPN